MGWLKRLRLRILKRSVDMISIMSMRWSHVQCQGISQKAPRTHPSYSRWVLKMGMLRMMSSKRRLTRTLSCIHDNLDAMTIHDDVQSYMMSGI